MAKEKLVSRGCQALQISMPDSKYFFMNFTDFMNARFFTIPECIVCGSLVGTRRFSKKGKDDAEYQLVACARCGLEFLHPRPSEDELARYYQGSYFTQRTDRGYNDYYSPETRREIERVIALNLKGVGFEKFEKHFERKPRSLDIGCAAGYFVNYLASRGWDAQGIDISKPCVDFAKNKLSLNVLYGNYLETSYTEKFDCITLWASIEHLHHPERVLRKAFCDLHPGGMIIISTCRQGVFSFMKLKGSLWRFYNFPEHLFFFSLSNLKRLLRRHGFVRTNSFTYGSGFGKAGKFKRRAADFLARHFRLGDMMVVSAYKKGRHGGPR
jgi:SAM-dependent methyltransferase